jgi:hypothetical protein
MSSVEEREVVRLRAQAAELRTQRQITQLTAEIDELKKTTPKPKKPPLPYGGLCSGGPWNGSCYSCAESHFELDWAGGEYRFDGGRWIWHRYPEEEVA